MMPITGGCEYEAKTRCVGTTSFDSQRARICFEQSIGISPLMHYMLCCCCKRIRLRMHNLRKKWNTQRIFSQSYKIECARIMILIACQIKSMRVIIMCLKEVQA